MLALLSHDSLDVAPGVVADVDLLGRERNEAITPGYFFPDNPLLQDALFPDGFKLWMLLKEFVC